MDMLIETLNFKMLAQLMLRLQNANENRQSFILSRKSIIGKVESNYKHCICITIIILLITKRDN